MAKYTVTLTQAKALFGFANHVTTLPEVAVNARLTPNEAHRVVRDLTRRGLARSIETDQQTLITLTEEGKFVRRALEQAFSGQGQSDGERDVVRILPDEGIPSDEEIDAPNVQEQYRTVNDALTGLIARLSR